MTHNENPEWLAHLEALLNGRYPLGADPWGHGAQIRVPGTKQPVPLARHHRVEPGDPQKVEASFKNRALTHTGKAQSVKEMLRTGFLASTERRRTMGVAKVGMSEGPDMATGGANSVFLRVKSNKSEFTHGHGITLVWDKPAAMFADASVYGYNSDMFGAINPQSKNLSSMTRDPHQMAKFTAGDNEVMFRNGLDLHGAAAPSRIITSSAEQRTEVLEIFKTQGITHLGGTPVEQIVKQGG